MMHRLRRILNILVLIMKVWRRERRMIRNVEARARERAERRMKVCLVVGEAPRPDDWLMVAEEDTMGLWSLVQHDYRYCIAKAFFRPSYYKERCEASLLSLH